MIDLKHSRNLPVRQRADCFYVQFLLPVLAAVLGFLFAGRVTAQTFTTLHTFSALSGLNLLSSLATNSDGAKPTSGLILSGSTLYGAAGFGGSSGLGTVFQVSTDGTRFKTIYTFGGSDGSLPDGGLALSANTLYGTTYNGGTFRNGNVFSVNTNGAAFTSLDSLSGADGYLPVAGLILSGKTLYGTAQQGGTSGNGTVFKINIDGTGFTTLHRFSAWSTNSLGVYTNSDGAKPISGLILLGNSLYGTAQQGGISGLGTVFKIDTNATGFTTLYNFAAGSTNFSGVATGVYINSDGAEPVAGLLLSGNTLFGTTFTGGSSGLGTVFAINTDGSGFTNLYTFTGGSDGANPAAGLILSGNSLYGTTQYGGSSGNGTVFAVNTDGTGFTTLHIFAGGSDGAGPEAGLILSSNTLYGTAHDGGSSGAGTVFSIFIQPRLTVTSIRENLVLTWPTNYAGFTLQSTANFSSSAVWTTNLPTPIVVNGQNTVTNPISGTRQFFRLSQ